LAIHAGGLGYLQSFEVAAQGGLGQLEAFPPEFLQNFILTTEFFA
jgi:hypothetical protein